MTSTPDELADLGPDQVDRLRKFLAENLPEGPNLDYKLQPSASIAKTVAAMANTEHTGRTRAVADLILPRC